MSYSCTSAGSSQDAPSCNKKCGGGVNPASRSATGHTDPCSPNHGESSSNPQPDEAMKVKKGCNTTDVGVPVTTEEELLSNTIITPEDVLGLQKITESK